MVGRDHFDGADGPLVRDLMWLGGAESCRPREPDMAARGQRSHVIVATLSRRPGHVAYLAAMRVPGKHIY